MEKKLGKTCRILENIFISSNSIAELYLFCISDFPISIFLQIPCLVRLEIHYLSFFDTKDPGSFQKTKLTRLLVYDISAKDLRVLLGGTANMFDLTQLQDLSIGFSNESLDTDVVDNLISSSGKLRTLNIQAVSCNSKMNTWRRMWNSWIGMGPLNLAKNLQPGCWKTLKTLNLLLAGFKRSLPILGTSTRRICRK